MTAIRAFPPPPPKLGQFFRIFEKRQGRPPPPPTSSYAPASREKLYQELGLESCRKNNATFSKYLKVNVRSISSE